MFSLLFSLLIKTGLNKNLLNFFFIVQLSSVLQPEIMARIMAHTNSDAPKADQETVEQTVLTQREQEVLTAVAGGQRSKEIASDLGVTERTIKAHLTNIYNKLGVDSRAAAVSVGMQQRIIKPQKDFY